jgi:lipoprotein-anchoring transpeptidase ErfK/SrfK
MPKGIDAVDPATNRTLKPGEPGNMYGSRFIELRRNVGIHGTDQPDKIGQYINRGSISMKNEDVEEVYGLVQIKPPTTVLVKGKVPQ